jgi:uncharacterized protein YcbK (DUF882 family)
MGLILINEKNNRRLHTNFMAYDFRCACCGYALINLDMVIVAQHVRNLVNRVVLVNSGWRCPRHNDEIGGADYSTHIRGDAADLTWSNAKKDLVNPEFRALIRKIPGLKGIGWGKTFLHIDVWEERKGLIEWSYL